MHQDGLFSFYQRTNPLIKITWMGDGLETNFYTDADEKKKALSQRQPNEVFVWVWQGKHRSDTFDVTPERIEKILKM